MIGRQVGAFRVLAPLGAGAMGIVYVAERLDTATRCALKILAPQLAQDTSLRERFEREARYATSIQHPNLLGVIDAGRDGDTLYIVTEYIEGGDLLALLDQVQRLDPVRAVRLISHVAAALDAAHNVGLMHRDVKPGNIMVAQPGTPQEKALLTDFGLGKNPNDDSVPLTQAGHFVGTVDYTAPEEILARDADHRVDVYSLGCVLFECLVGTPPFPRKNEVDVMYAHVQDERPRPSEHGADIPPALDDVVLRALAQSPEERFGTCGELAAAAQKVLGLELSEVATAERDLVLEVTAGNARQSRIALQDSLDIGRLAPGFGNLQRDPQLSRRHARIYRDGTRRMVIEDLGSTNGTFVNGDRIVQPIAVAPGDVIKLGSSLLTVRVEAPADVPPTGEATQVRPVEMSSTAVASHARGESERIVVDLGLSLEIDSRMGTGTVRLGGGMAEVSLEYVDGRWRARNGHDSS